MQPAIDQKIESDVELLAERILIVDDESGLRRLMRVYLESEKFEVYEAADGEEGIEIIRAKPVDLVITDLQMPLKNGMELLDEIKQYFPAIPVVIMSGMPDIAAAVHCIKLGATDFISKPFKLSKIRKVVSSVLREKQRALSQSRDAAGSGSYSRVLAGYEIKQTLGEGNMGVVFLATRTNSDGGQEQYALKILKPVTHNEEKRRIALERFLREAETASKLDHPNIVSILDHGLADEEQIPYMAMEYVEGVSLRDLIQERTPLNYRQKALIIQQSASALAEIHRHGICHRDIKPANILLDEELNAKVTDFGIALYPDSELTLSANIIGTPVYLSPEGFKSPKVDPRSDIFSLGTLAYEFFLLGRPFVGDSIGQYAHIIQFERPVEPRKVDPKFPVKLQMILAKMMRKDPDQRYVSANELIAELDDFLNDRADRAGIFHKVVDRWRKHDWR